MSGAWVNYRNRLAGVPGHTEQLYASGGAWNCYVNVSDDMGLGWLISSAPELQTQVQTGTKVPRIKKYCRGKKRIIMISYTQFHCCNPFLLWTETRHWKDSSFGGFCFLSFRAVLVCMVVVHCCPTSPLLSPPPFSLLSLFCLLRMFLSKLWFRKIVLLFTLTCPGFLNLSWLALCALNNWPESFQSLETRILFLFSSAFIAN